MAMLAKLSQTLNIYCAPLLLISFLIIIAETKSWFSDEWQTFKDEFNKSYSNEQEDSLRMSIYFRNKKFVEESNLKSNKLGYKMSLNHLADWTEYELEKLRGLKVPEKADECNSEMAKFLMRLLSGNSTKIPDQLDWRNVSGRVSQIKDQGPCGSCWAFAATGALEGQMMVRSRDKLMIPLSEQNLIMCSSLNFGCSGGWPAYAFADIKTEGGIESETSYPYTAYDDPGDSCAFNSSLSVFTDIGSMILPQEGDEETLKRVVANFGPVAIGLDSKGKGFNLYKSGVYSAPECGSKRWNLDHAALVVGYGTDAKQGDYWIVKNSWGTLWGDDGYILMARNKNNHCGVATVPTIPTF